MVSAAKGASHKTTRFLIIGRRLSTESSKDCCSNSARIRWKCTVPVLKRVLCGCSRCTVAATGALTLSAVCCSLSLMSGDNQQTLWQRWVRQPQKIWLRRALFQVHLWNGLVVGIYVLMMSMTGSVLVYSNELY